MTQGWWIIPAAALGGAVWLNLLIWLDPIRWVLP